MSGAFIDDDIHVSDQTLAPSQLDLLQNLTNSGKRSWLTAVPTDVTALLRDNGLRATAARVAVLSAVANQPHAPAEDIALAARAQVGAVSTAAVYDVLNALTAAGLIRRIEPAGSPARYETRVADNHHHVVCRRCGAVGDVDCTVGAAPCLEPSSTNGFVLDEAEVTWWGLCADCAHRTAMDF